MSRTGGNEGRPIVGSAARVEVAVGSGRRVGVAVAAIVGVKVAVAVGVMYSMWPGVREALASWPHAPNATTAASTHHPMRCARTSTCAQLRTSAAHHPRQG